MFGKTSVQTEPDMGATILRMRISEHLILYKRHKRTCPIERMTLPPTQRDITWNATA